VFPHGGGSAGRQQHVLISVRHGLQVIECWGAESLRITDFNVDVVRKDVELVGTMAHDSARRRQSLQQLDAELGRPHLTETRRGTRLLL